MRKVLQIVGGLALVILLIGGISIGLLIHFGRMFDAESKAFIDDAIPAIATDWNEDQLLRRAAPELLNSTSPDRLKSLFATFSRVGKLVSYEGSIGDSNMQYLFNSGWTVSATYAAKARFRDGDATFRITLLRRNGKWAILNFRFDTAPNGNIAQPV